MNRPAFRIAAAAALIVFCYLTVLVALVGVWTGNSRYSYGLAVPLISGYVVWTKWEELKQAFGAPDYRLGGTLIVLAIALLAVGRVGALMSLQGISLILAIAASVALVAGRATLKALWFPIGYLVLMLPIWDFAINWFQQPSQELAATMATRLLRMSGLAAFQQGTTIALATVSLEVMPECSGINQLIALTTMALPAAYLWIKTGTRRALLIALAIVVGYLSNGLRVALLGWMTVAGLNVSDGHSLMHLMPGFTTASLAYLILAGCISWLSNGASTAAASSSAVASSASPRSEWPVRRPALEAVIVVLMLGAGAAQLLATPLNDIRPDHSLNTLPSEIAGWQLEAPVAGSVPRFLGFDIDLMRVYRNATGEVPFVAADDEILRTYRSPAGRRVQVYVGYYGQQKDGKELTGDASQSLQRVASSVTLPIGTSSFAVKEVVQQTDSQHRGVMFWYDVNGRVLSNAYAVKGFTLWDALTRRRTNGAVVMIAWDASEGLGSDRQDAFAFAQALLPVVHQRLPS